MDQHRIAYLHKRYLAGTLSAAEAREWQQLLADPQHEAAVKSLMHATWRDTSSTAPRHWHTERGTLIFSRIIQAARPTRIRLWISAAAIFIAAVLVGYFAVINRKSMPDGPSVAEISPGGNRATLLLADGRTIDLSEAQTGIIVGDGITYLDGSKIIDMTYEAPSMRTDSASASYPESHVSQIMSLTTPKAGQYQVMLPDGTEVWLNAASTLKYPSRFDGHERVVELEGEAYFEVKRETRDIRHETSDRKTYRPFRVVSNGQTVEVLGTEFNISAYADEAETKTTLVEGKVRVGPNASGSATRNAQYAILTHGQQSVIYDGQMEIHEVDPGAAAAWRNGRFSFDGKDLQQVMRELARWYDINVIYEGPAPDIRFFGGIHRNNKLSTVMNLLETNGIAYRLEADRTLILSSAKQQNRKEG